MGAENSPLFPPSLTPFPSETNLKVRQPLPETAELEDDTRKLSDFNGEDIHTYSRTPIIHPHTHTHTHTKRAHTHTKHAHTHTHTHTHTQSVHTHTHTDTHHIYA